MLRDLAQIGATLFVAYAVEVSWLEKVSPVQTAARERWIGIVLGVGACGLLGIIVSLGLAERAAVGHWAWLDEIAFAGVSASLGLLAMVVALCPLLVHEWNRNLDRGALDESE
jgi:hypothetical protein